MDYFDFVNSLVCIEKKEKMAILNISFGVPKKKKNRTGFEEYVRHSRVNEEQNCHFVGWTVSLRSLFIPKGWTNVVFLDTN